MTIGVAQLSAVLGESRFTDIPRAVGHTNELDRVLGLPRRTWREDDPAVVRLTLEISAWARRPGSTVTLRAIQGFGLAELYHVRGLFGPMRVGSGKTLITFLAPTIIGAKRPVLVIPAKLREKTFREFEKLSKDWKPPESLQIISYEELSRDYGSLVVTTPEGYQLAGPPSQALVNAYKGKPVQAYYATDGHWWPGGTTWTQLAEFGILDRADPDLIVADEVHRMKNTKAACTRKMERFMRSHPLVPHVDVSGTITKDKIQDYAHILFWSLKGYAPVPRTYTGVQEWGNALNVKVSEDDRLDVGALIEFASPEERKNCDETTAARRGFRRRLIETPGVVAYAKQFDGASLLIEEALPPNFAACTEEDFAKLRNDNKRADGTGIPDALGVWAYARQRALGFYYTYDPPPPLPWKNARTEWHAAVRQCTKHGSMHRIDSEWQVANAVVQHPDWADPSDKENIWTEAGRAYAAWVAVRDGYKADQHKVAVWRDYAAIEAVAKWMANHKGLVWCDHIEFAEQLSHVTGAPFFHEKGYDKSGRFVEDASPTQDGSIIVSIEANTEGRNLQHNWSENYFTSVPKGGLKNEQALGRTHREGQTADEVTAEYLISCREQLEAWEKILEESRYMVDSTMEIEEGQALPAKVFYADMVMPGADELFLRGMQTARFR